ncbi:LysR family transcriptional regulator [Jannaschia sp. LMIT008]|uniref:LysR family transcriptional regulator n=1 Tax=Jannaschia maritima TaxID=3032585 RepID=UPI002810CC3B|nr:LysR family transcriptional regulator [Jannaschia sp. LMIT008]
MDKKFATFLAVARTGSITEAARTLNITQPTLTKRLQLLEGSLGCKLFQRLPRGIRLTAEGEGLLPHARRMQHEHFQGLEAVRAVRSGQLADLRIGAGPLFHSRYLSWVFAHLRADHPETTPRLFADFNSRIVPRLLDGRLDLSFGTRSPDAERGGLAFHHLMDVERGLVVRKGHPAAQRRLAAAREMRGLGWVAFSNTDEMEDLVAAYLAAQALPPPDILLQTTSLSLAFETVATTDAAMVLPIQMAPVLSRHGLVVVRVTPSFGILPAGAHLRASAYEYPVVRRTIELMRDAIEQGGTDTPAADIP